VLVLCAVQLWHRTADSWGRASSSHTFLNKGLLNDEKIKQQLRELAPA